MQFRLDRFYRINRRALIWVAIAALLYILRSFFALIFVTFLLVSFALPVVDYFQRNTRFPRKLIIVTWFLMLLAGFVWLIIYITPRVTREASHGAVQLVQLQNRILTVKDDLKKWQPTLGELVDENLSEQMIASYLDDLRTKHVQPILVNSAKLALATISTILLSLLFSFLIVLDLTRLKTEVRLLERSRLHDFYQEFAQPVVHFAAVLAKAFRAQALIAITNTVLTLAGLLALGIPNVALLSIIVFFFSFIPVLGVFISTTPAVLIAINMSGYSKAIGVIALVTVIHLIEAYVLNPLIYGSHLKLNPVIVLIILFVAHHFFGIWGMVLGVPVTYYFLYYVFGVPREEQHAAPEPVEDTGTLGP